jgi:hypothetical protein
MDNEDTAQAPEPAERETTAADCDTQAAAPPDEPPTTVVPPTEAPEPELAWSQATDDTEPAQRRSWRSAWGIVGVIAACSAVLAGAAGIALWFNKSHDNKPNVINQQQVPPPVTATAKAAPAPSYPAPPVYVPPPPSQWGAPPVFTSADKQFLSAVRNWGIDLPTANAAKYAIDNAHFACNYLASHTRAETVTYVQSLTMWRDQDSASKIVTSAQVVYCPQLL